MQVKVKPWVFWVVLLSPILAAGLTILYLREENERGEREWVRCQQNLQAKGQSINWNEYVPPPIPADQNFFAAPKMQTWFVKNRTNTNNELASALANPKSEAPVTNPAEATAYLAWVGKFEPQFDLIRQALRRPEQRMDGAYSDPTDIPVLAFPALRAVSETLSQKAKCELLLQQPEKALADLSLLLGLSRIAEPPPRVPAGTMMAAILKDAMVAAYSQDAAMGIQHHAWNETQLAVLAGQMEHIDLLPSLAGAVCYDRVSTCYTVENEWTTGKKHSVGPVILYGYLCENLVAISDWDERTVESIDLRAHRMQSDKINAVEAEVAGKHSNARNGGTTVLLNLGACKTIANSQVLVDQTQIACALERYHLAVGLYPTSLATLVPRYLPQIPSDIFDGKPMTYVPKWPQKFLLYSVGWNETDDGGTIAHKNDGSEDLTKGDWVWHYSPD